MLVLFVLSDCIMKQYPVVLALQLLLLMVSRNFTETNDLEETWSNWTPCNRACGMGVRRREKICKESWCEKHFIVEEQPCGRNCSTDPDYRRSECAAHDSGLPILYNYGTVRNPSNFPSPHSPNKFCQGRSGPYFTLKSGTIPFSLVSIEFQSVSMVRRFSLKYKLSGYNQWFSYPTNSYKTILNVAYIPYSLPKYRFLIPLQGVEFEITIEHPEYYFGYFCYQISFRGCHLPLPAELTLGPTYVEKWLLPPFTVIPHTYFCVTTFFPFYYKHMHVVNGADGSLVTNDFSQRIRTSILQRNDYNYLQLQVMGLAINLVSLAQLYEEFDCFVKNGFMYCVRSFHCNGKTESHGDDLYGHFDAGYLTLVYAHDINECNDTEHLAGCSSDSSCVNTNGSFYCLCRHPYVGDGFTCHTKDKWVKGQLGPYYTKLVEDSPNPDFYCRGLFFSVLTKKVFVCSRFRNDRPYGCVVSTDFGDSWEQMHSRLDIIFGENLNNGRLYGYSSLDSAYIMFLPNSKRMFSIARALYEKNKSRPKRFHNDKILLPSCTVFVHEKRDEFNYPLETTFMNISTYTFAMTTDGIMRRQLNGTDWTMKIRWNDMPVKTK